jgi:hypothetical protein
MNPRALLQARRFGSFRYATLFDSTNNLTQVLLGFGLTAEPLLLVEVDVASAVEIVSSLLWKDMVHGIENMPHEQAMRWAREIIEENSSESATYYSNKADSGANSWNPLTNSTFDSGIIIRNQDGLNFCLWFEEED